MPGAVPKKGSRLGLSTSRPRDSSDASCAFAAAPPPEASSCSQYREVSDDVLVCSDCVRGERADCAAEPVST